MPFYPSSLAMSPDGRYVAIGGRVLNVDTWPLSTPKPVFGDPPLPDMALIAIVDLAKRTITRTIQIPDAASVNSLAWSPDGAYIAAGGNGVMIFDAQSLARVVHERKGDHVHIRYTPDGKYFIENGFGEKGTRVRIWDGRHRDLLQEIPAKPACLAVSRDGRYLAMGGDKKIIVWKLK